MADKTTLLLEAERRGILPPARQAALDEARRRGLIDAPRDAPREEPFALPFLNQAIAGTLGGPVDLMNFGLSLLGVDIEDPAGGSASIEALMRGGGVTLPEPGKRPTTLGQRVERGVGEAAGALLPFGTVAKVVGQGAGLAGQIARSITETAVKAPIVSGAVELGSGGASGVGAEVAAQNFPDNDTAEALGALAGGLSPVGLFMAPRAAVRVAEALPVTGAIVRGTRAAITPFTRAGGTIRAEARAQSLVSDPEAVARGLQTEQPGVDLTVAQQTGETRLLALEREVLNKDVALESEFAEQTAGATQQLRDELAVIGRGNVDDTRTFIEKRRERLNNALELRAQQAATEAERRVKLLEPERRATESSEIVRDEIEKTLVVARDQEEAIWLDVEQDIMVPTAKTKKTYVALRDDLGRAQREDIPDAARRFLDVGNQEFGAEESVREIRSLYSKLRESARIARSRNQLNTARIAGRVADAILNDLDSVENVSEAFNLARSFSRDLNTRFTEGAVGRVLERAPGGGARVEPELTLQTTLGRGGDRGSVEARQILAAAPGAETEMGQFILGQFQQAAVRNGKFNPAAAREFVRKTNILDRFPGLRRSMLEAANAQERVGRVGARAERVGKALKATNRTAAGGFLGENPDKGISRVIRSRDPRGAARELRRQVRKDPTGKALAGLKAATIDHLIGKSESGSIGLSGEKQLSGRAMKAAINEKSTKRAVSEILSDDEIKRINRIADELAKIERGRDPLPDIGGAIDDSPAALLSIVIRVLAAQQGRAVAGRLGGGTVQTPGIFSSRAQKLLTNLTNNTARELLTEAVKDKRLMIALLAPRGTAAAKKAAARRFNAWIAGPGKQFAESLSAGEEE